MLDKSFITQSELQQLSKTWPGMIYQKDKDFRYVTVNDPVIDFYGCSSKDSFIEHLDKELSWYDLADRFGEQDSKVLQGYTHIDTECVTVYDKSKRVVLTQKLPVIDQSRKIVGVGVFTVPISMNALTSLPKLLFSNSIIQNQMHNTQKEFNYGDLSFTRRQAQCISLALRGYTEPEIAEELDLKLSTVNSYFGNIREKLGSTKRSSVFEKAVEYGFIDLMFMVIL